MRHTRSLGLAAATLAVLSPLASAPAAQASQSAQSARSAQAAPAAPAGVHNPQALAATTRANLLDAMHGEAKARASYLAYAAQARREGRPAVAKLFTATAATELGDHFALEAGHVRLVRSNEANLADAIDGENYEATTMYPQFEAQARAQGDRRAADLFHEIAADEATHRDAYRKALAALRGTGHVPKPPALDAVTVPAGPARSSGATLDNLRKAMAGESFASAAYLAYAEHARRTGHADVAALFTAISDIELKEHFNAEAALAGLVGSSRRNLATAAAGEHYEATTMYPRFARQAKAAGDRAVAATFIEIASDEAAHRDAFIAARHRLPRH